MEIDAINFRLDAFEGPLDLLLHLISKNKVNIYDIPIALILEQYMEYINTWKDMNFNIAGEFIVMASELMLIKSKMLLPKHEDEEEEDPREALARALVEYKKAKETAKVLDGRFKEFHGRIIKDPEVIEKDVDYSSQDISLLYTAFENVMRRVRAMEENTEKALPPTDIISGIIRKKTYSVFEKIMDTLRYMYRQENVGIYELFNGVRDKMELVTVFVAILELLKAQRISIVSDEETEDDNVILKMDKVNHFSVMENMETDY